LSSSPPPTPAKAAHGEHKQRPPLKLAPGIVRAHEALGVPRGFVQQRRRDGFAYGNSQRAMQCALVLSLDAHRLVMVRAKPLAARADAEG
jgi:hypothetical protein